MEKERVEIKLSKTKNVLTFLGSVAFVVSSVFLIIVADRQERFSPLLVQFVGVLGLAFFGLCGVYIFIKAFDRKPGLVVDGDGILDNSSAAAGQLIKWDKITGIRKHQIMSTKFIPIDIENPEQFIDQATGLKKKLMWGNYKAIGTPTSISSTALTCNFDELFDLINGRLKSRLRKG
jgi:hypothetical protein